MFGQLISSRRDPFRESAWSLNKTRELFSKHESDQKLQIVFQAREREAQLGLPLLGLPLISRLKEHNTVLSFGETSSTSCVPAGSWLQEMALPVSPYAQFGLPLIPRLKLYDTVMSFGETCCTSCVPAGSRDETWYASRLMSSTVCANFAISVSGMSCVFMMRE